MKSFLILSKIKVENANAISGLVYGFPAVTHFLGFVHALSRQLGQQHETAQVELGGCAIICHSHQLHAYKTGGDYGFSLTRNPLTKDAKTSPFNEEGRINLEVSLVIECDFTSDDFDFGTNDSEQDRLKFCELILQLAKVRRLAGGSVREIAKVDFIDHDVNIKMRSKLLKLLPGFALCDRSDILAELQMEDPEVDLFDKLIEFTALKSQAKPLQKLEEEKVKADWVLLPKSHSGWIVPIQSGFKAISPLYEKGEVQSARDMNVPFRFVEPVYGLGEWRGLHRIKDITKIIWNYYLENDHYVCVNKIN